MSGGGANTGNVSSLAWLQMPRIDNLGQPDPYGGFPKPDSNIQTQTFQPIGALLPGTVTNVDTSSPWGYAVTVKLDKPLNNLATHTAYLHLGRITVSQGQHVNVGDVLGVAGAPSGFQQAGTGFALYSGDKYGYGSDWSNMTVANLTGNGPLNPVPLLNGNQQTLRNAGGDITAIQNANQPSQCGAFDIGCWMKQLQTNMVSWGEHIAVFVIGLILIIVGLLLIGFKPAENIAQKVGKAAMLT